jgi:hypothetical protein
MKTALPSTSGLAAGSSPCRKRGIWERTAGKYTKIHIGPETLNRMLTGAGFGIEYFAVDNGMITALARKDA